MNKATSLFFLLLIISFVITKNTTEAKDLLKAPEGMIRYKLSNLQVGTGFTGDGFSFDYEKTRDGEGYPSVIIQTNRGPLRILGAPIRIEKSGTVNLRNMFSRVQSIIDPDNDDGMAIYFVINASDPKPFLVSNIIRTGSKKVKVSSRSLTDQEREELERRRIAKLPPAEVPEGYVRSQPRAQLIPGLPILYGLGGQWQKGVTVNFPSQGVVRIKPEDSNVLHLTQIAQWTAVLESDLQQAISGNHSFSTDIRTLSGSNLALEPNLIPLDPTIELLPGTPLSRDQRNTWQEVFFISSDNVAVRILNRRQDGQEIEFVPHTQLAIKKESLAAQQDQQATQSLAENINGYEKSMQAVNGLLRSTISNSNRKPPTVRSTLPQIDRQAESPKTAGDLRIWKDRSGVFEIEARFIERDGNSLLLKRADQRTISVPLQSLSDNDQRYIEDLEKPTMNPFNNVVDPAPKNKNTNHTSDYQKVMQPILIIDDLSWGPKSLAISPDNQLLIIGRKAAAASLIDLNTGKVLLDSDRMDAMGDIGVAAFTPNGEHMILGGNEGRFQVYSIDANQQFKMVGQYPMHNREITAIAISPDSKTAFSGDIDKTARLWDISSGSPLMSIDGFAGKIKATCISGDGLFLMATDGKTLTIASVKDKQVVQSLEIGKSHASGQAAAFSQDGSILAVGDGYNIELWNTSEGRKEGLLQGKEINWSMRFSPDQRFLMSGGNGCIYAWDCKTRQLLQTNRVGKSFYVQAIGISSDGSLIASPSAFSEVTLLQAAQ